jgi:hypothetical protein
MGENDHLQAFTTTPSYFLDGMVFAECVLAVERIVEDNNASRLVAVVLQLGEKERQANVLLSPELNVLRKLGVLKGVFPSPRSTAVSLMRI